MGQVSAVLRKTQFGYAHWCPGCEEMHVIYTERPRPGGARWSFDGNVDKPSFSPSIHITWGRHADPSFKEESADESGICHYVITGGEIRFCSDSTHALAGRCVPLPALPGGVTD